MRHRRFLGWLLVIALAVGFHESVSAQLGSRSAEEWAKALDQPTRVAGLKIDEIVERLQLKPGQIVTDIGAGTGLFSLPMARAVAPGGKVYAVEVEAGLLDVIGRKAKEQQAANVQTVLGKFTDPNLPAAGVDLALFHDVLHHIQDRAAYVKTLARYMKPSARIAIIEFDQQRGAPAHRDQPEMQVTKAQVAAWMADAGFAPAEEFDLFADRWFVVYSR